MTLQEKKTDALQTKKSLLEGALVCARMKLFEEAKLLKIEIDRWQKIYENITT